MPKQSREHQFPNMNEPNRGKSHRAIKPLSWGPQGFKDVLSKKPSQSLFHAFDNAMARAVNQRRRFP